MSLVNNRDPSVPTREDIEHILANLVTFFKDGARSPYPHYAGYKPGQAIPMRSAEQSTQNYPAMIEVISIQQAQPDTEAANKIAKILEDPTQKEAQNSSGVNENAVYLGKRKPSVRFSYQTISNFEFLYSPSHKSIGLSQNPFAIDGRASENSQSPRSIIHPDGLSSPLLSNMNWEMNSNAEPPQLSFGDRYDSLNLGRPSDN